MADVLAQQGKPGEALRTKQALGDVRGVAVTQANLEQLRLQMGEPVRACRMLWAA